MLHREDNELLCRVGPGTAMGETLRQYWLPILLSSELPGPDCPPERLKLLGENLVAFRDTDGQVGLIAENCPHRGASMFFGRNEENGLRCVYHGWKFDRSGTCTDMPNEPPESNFKHKVRIAAYKTTERNGVIWAYLGQREIPPELPSLEWSLLPAEQRYISKRYEKCNWAQGLEGGIDSSHSGFLHMRLHRQDDLGSGMERGLDYKRKDKHPHFEVVDTNYGVLVGARRAAEEDSWYWRITQFLMPFYTMIPSYGESPVIGGHAWVPIDDENTMAWSVSWHPTRALTSDELTRMQTYPGSGIHVGENGYAEPLATVPQSRWMPRANSDNDYDRDFELERTYLFSGIPNLGMQDQAMQESMGAMYDRTRERLGTSDTGIIQVRRRWLKAARELRDNGTVPIGVEVPEAYRVRSAGVILPRNVTWVEGSHELLQATPGVHHPSA
jgi:phenylpropionate dioxygenase-like ring-hydroxylating dioxygenase large terminal subunit